jgi:hypothetical protein
MPNAAMELAFFAEREGDAGVQSRGIVKVVAMATLSNRAAGGSTALTVKILREPSPRQSRMWPPRWVDFSSRPTSLSEVNSSSTK